MGVICWINLIVIKMSKVYLSNKCPICGNKIYLNSHGYRCERCSFHIKNYICNRHLTIEEVEDILAGKQIILDGFSSNMGEVFSSCLLYTSDAADDIALV